LGEKTKKEKGEGEREEGEGWREKCFIRKTHDFTSGVYKVFEVCFPSLSTLHPSPSSLAVSYS
jgi:hypothetical protein